MFSLTAHLVSENGDLFKLLGEMEVIVRLHMAIVRYISILGKAKILVVHDPISSFPQQQELVELYMVLHYERDAETGKTLVSN